MSSFVEDEEDLTLKNLKGVLERYAPETTAQLNREELAQLLTFLTMTDLLIMNGPELLELDISLHEGQNLKKTIESYRFLRDLTRRVKERGPQTNMQHSVFFDTSFGKSKQIKTIKKIAGSRNNWSFKQVDKLYNLLFK